MPEINPVVITEWEVPWASTRPRDPFVDQQNLVWFVGQTGDYLASLDPSNGNFTKHDLDPGTGPHNLIVDKKGMVWYAGNRAAHIGKLDPATETIIKYPMPDPAASDPHTLIFGKHDDIWFTVQGGNSIGHLIMKTGHVQLTPLPTVRARPYGIALTSAGIPWFTEFGVNKLGKINPATTGVEEIVLPRKEARPRRLAITSDQAVWYVDYVEGFLGRLDLSTGSIHEWPVPGKKDGRPYGMASDNQDRIWYVETGVHPNRLVGFDTKTRKVISLTSIPSGGGTVRHMVYHPPTQTIWFGTDANTIGRAQLPQ